MNTITELGTNDPTITYADRPTVKVLIQQGKTILILNNGLLPGGGIDEGETDIRAIEREVSEELGASVTEIAPVGEVVQYRDFLEKRYIIKGFSAQFVAFDKETDPQDSGEAAFSYRWLEKDDALQLVNDSIDTYANVRIEDDSQQGKVFNLMTTRALLLTLS